MLHQKLARKLQFLHIDKTSYYNHVPEPIRENAEYQLYWEKQFENYRAELILVSKLIDLAIKNNKNLRSNYNEKNP